MVAVLYNMLLSGTVMVLLHRLDVRTDNVDAKADENMQKSATMLSEAGVAITETLKIAFDNLKKVSGNVSKSQGKLSDHETRLHRLEQMGQRSAIPNSKLEAIKQIERQREEVKPPRRQSPLNRPPEPPIPPLPNPPTK